VNTAITKIKDIQVVRGWIFYDAACAPCVRGRQRTGRLFQSRGFEWLPLQTPGAAARLGVPEYAFETRMHLLTSDGRVLHNADALGVLCRSVWWLWPLGLLLLVPGFRELGRLAYDWFARNRYCVGGVCRVDTNARRDIEGAQ
jgi:predicted DCC family thiol-disulfide oxidoreductase YuxK